MTPLCRKALEQHSATCLGTAVLLTLCVQSGDLPEDVESEISRVLRNFANKREADMKVEDYREAFLRVGQFIVERLSPRPGTTSTEGPR